MPITTSNSTASPTSAFDVSCLPDPPSSHSSILRDRPSPSPSSFPPILTSSWKNSGSLTMKRMKRRRAIESVDVHSDSSMPYPPFRPFSWRLPQDITPAVRPISKYARRANEYRSFAIVKHAQPSKVDRSALLNVSYIPQFSVAAHVHCLIFNL